MVCFDLDDTLYPEYKYVQSAYKAIASYMHKNFDTDSNEIYNLLWETFNIGNNAFDNLLKQYPLWGNNECAIKKLLHIYRFHNPEIHLDRPTLSTLETFAKSGVKMGIITDGRIITQRNKINALNLTRFVNIENIIISEQTGFDKTSNQNFITMMRQNPKEHHFVYVADNPEKDFLHPNKLGWTTIMLKDQTGKNIHPQKIFSAAEFNSKYVINSLPELQAICLTI